MNKLVRPTPLRAFLKSQRRIEVFFHTSNIEKYLQARLVFRRCGLSLQHFQSKTDPYSEDYSGSKSDLLANAIAEVLSAIGEKSIFFVEDTSLRIDALSHGSTDFPGLSVKEWFANQSFQELDQELQERGNNRAAIVKSDIGLHLPGLDRVLFFRGETAGVVADTIPTFAESKQYPWLTPKTFNGWFIPYGAGKRLGEMSFEESYKFDFRCKALLNLIERLEEYSVALNLPTSAYSVVHRDEQSEQLTLFANQAQGYVVVGRTCAGKTTLGDYVEEKYGLTHIEASSIVRMVQREQGRLEQDSFMFAKDLLETNGADYVARRIVELYGDTLHRGFVITGFRTIEELEVIRNLFPRTTVLLLSASERTRYGRYRDRARDDIPLDFHGFLSEDEKQWTFGLLRIAEDFANFCIQNEGTHEDFYEQIDAILEGKFSKGVRGVIQSVSPRENINTSQVYRTLKVLSQSVTPLTCDEISNLTGSLGEGRRILQNNVNKVLKRVPELARRIESNGSPLRYELLNAGRSYVRLMEQWYESQQTRSSDTSRRIPV